MIFFYICLMALVLTLLISSSQLILLFFSLPHSFPSSIPPLLLPFSLSFCFLNYTLSFTWLLKGAWVKDYFQEYGWLVSGYTTEENISVSLGDVNRL